MDISQWLYSAGVFIAVLLAGLVLQKTLHARLNSWRSKTVSSEDLQTLFRPLSGLIVVFAFGSAVQVAPLVVRSHPLLGPGIRIAIVLIIIWFLERLAAVFVRTSRFSRSLTASSRTLVLTIARVGIFVIGVLIVLDTIGVSITPLLASLGVGSLAVALALQDTLSNFFGGLYILADKPVRIGDLVRIDDIDGRVVEIGWRSTRIQTSGNDTIVVPNSKVASSQLRNYDLPDSASVILIPCGVSYAADLNQVERIAIEVVEKAFTHLSDLDKTFAPAVRFTAFGDSSIQFNLIVRVLKFSNAGLVRHELIKALHSRFNSEKIEIPFPQRVIHWNPPPNP